MADTAWLKVVFDVGENRRRRRSTASESIKPHAYQIAMQRHPNR